MLLVLYNVQSPILLETGQFKNQMYISMYKQIIKF